MRIPARSRPVRLRWVLLAALAVGLAAPSGPALAAEETWSADLADELMSPYCPGRTLRSCPSPEAGDLIVWLEEQEAQGRDRDAVYEQLLAEFGDEIRQAPTTSGFGVAAYVIPVVAFLTGGVLLVVFLRRQRRDEGASDTSAAPPPATDPELERLVDQELRRSP